MTDLLFGLESFPPIATLVLLAVFGGGLVHILTRSPEMSGVGRAAFIAVLADVAVLIAILAFSPALSSDAVDWHRLAAHAAERLNGQTRFVVPYVQGKEGYVWIVGWLYSIAGPAPLVAIAFGIFCHALAVVAVGKSAALIVDAAGTDAKSTRPAIVRASYLVALLPIFVWWAPHVLRESLTTALVAASICFTLLSLVRRRLWPLILAAASVAVLTSVRSTLGIIVGLAIGASLLFILAGRSRLRLLLRTALILAIAVLFPMSQASLAATLAVSEKTVVVTTAELSSIASSGFPGLGYGADIAQVLAVTAPRAILGPFPWEWRLSLVMLLSFVELVCWGCVVILSLRGLRRFRSGEPLHGSRWLLPAILLVALVVLVGLMFTVGNYGILARFRPIASIVLVPLAAFGTLAPISEPARQMRGGDLRRR